MSESIRREVFFPHDPDEIWRALTDRAALEDWLMPNDFEPRVGHRFTFRTEPNPRAGFDGVVRCEVLECERPSRLAYTWATGELKTKVIFRLEPEGDGTRLHLEQSGFDPSDPTQEIAYRGADYGWTKMLEQLGRVIADPPAREGAS